MLSGFLCEKLGRKRGMFVVNPIFFAGFLLSGLAQSLHLLLLGKVLLGFAAGAQATPSSSYFSDITSPSIRSALHCTAGVFNCIGIVVAPCLARFSVAWRIASLCFAAAPVLGCLHLLMVAESPSFFLSKGKHIAAGKALRKLRGPKYPIQVELDYLTQSTRQSAKRSGGLAGLLARFQEPDVWKPLIIINVTFILQTATGFHAMRGYTVLFQEASGSRLNPYDGALFSRIAVTFGQLSSVFLTGKMGPRRLLTLSAFCSCLSYVAFASSFLLHPQSTQDLLASQNNSSDPELGTSYHPFLDYFPLLSLSLLCFTFTCGLGPLPWVLSNELYPMDLRSALYSMTTCLVPLQFFIVAKVMPNLCLMLGISPTLFTFSFICLLTSVWSWCVIPETRGLTLTQISLSFSGRKETAEEREAEVKARLLHMGARIRMPRMESFTNSIG